MKFGWYLEWYYENIMWALKGYPIPPADPVKVKTVKEYAARYNMRLLVETGTYLGQMVNDTKDVFDNIFSIELDKHLYNVARKRFAKDCNVYLLQGDSSKTLLDILRVVNEPILFWLDAHYSGGLTSKGDEETPILSELRAIMKHPNIKDHVILIDDARCFENQDPGYPSIVFLQDVVRSSGQELVMYVENDIIRIHSRTRCYS